MPIPKDKNGLTAKQRRFVEEYLVDLNATGAARRAGYSEDTAHAIGWENLRKPEISIAIQAAMNERAKATKVTAERVVHELALVAFANMAEYIAVQPDGGAVVDLSELTPDRGAAIQEITSEVYMEGGGEDAVQVKRTKLKLHARTKALDMLGRHTGAWVNRHEHTGPGGGPIEMRDKTLPLDKLPLKDRRDLLKKLEKLADSET